MRSNEEAGSELTGDDGLRPCISVVIPAYNCSPFLVSTLESVFAQTLPAHEVIVVDDGSTDATSEVLAPYLDRIIYLKQENKGLPAARNRGLRAAKGDYIALLDADDSWLPMKLERQIPRLREPETGIVYTDFSVRYSDGRSLRSYLADRPLAGEGNILDSYVQSRFLFPSTMVFRRSCFEQVGYFDEEMLACEDIELFSRMCAHWKVAFVNETLMVRYEGSHNITSDNKKMSDYTILAFEKLLQKEPDLSSTTREVIFGELGRQHTWAGAAAFKQGRMGKSRRNLAQAYRYDRRTLRTNAAMFAASFLPTAVIRLLRRPINVRKKD